MPRAPALVEVFLDGGTGMAPPGSWQITRRWKNHGYVRRLVSSRPRDEPAKRLNVFMPALRNRDQGRQDFTLHGLCGLITAARFSRFAGALLFSR